MNKVIVENLNLRYSDGVESLKNISFNIQADAITVLFGPAGGGKSTFLRVLNRMNDMDDVSHLSGKVLFDGINILDPKINVIDLRRKIGMVFSRPVPLPLTIYKNVSYGLELICKQQKAGLDEAVERALTQVTLWDEVKDRLNDPAYSLSGGQQQRLAWRVPWRSNLR
ncbi:MAG TPA: ATP-binding cassette domain-containing protein [Anaerolineaceae bacterium]|nr:ATP-binding cassette domain-containing protein [Anaerolineaceae bacterium]